MKVKLFLVISVFSFAISFSQKANCADIENELANLIEKSDYSKANELVVSLKSKCAQHSESFYKLGIIVLQHNVDAASNDKKQTEVNQLVELYNLYDQNFPKNDNGNDLNKALLLFNSSLASNEEIFKLLDIAFTKNKFNFKSGTILYQYFNTITQKFNNKEIKFASLIQKYGEISEVLDVNIAKFPENELEYKNAKMAIKSLVNNNFKKENIVEYTELNFEDQKENIAWLNSSINLLSEKNSELPIFGKVAQQYYNLQPSANSAYHLANFNLKNKNQEKALQLFEQSASLSIDKIEKANIYFLMSKMYGTNQKEKSKNLLEQAILNDQTNGKYYIFLANLYTNSVSTCSSSNIERVAIYELAKQTVLRGAEKEPRLKTSAENLIEQYKKNSPSEDDLKQIKKMGNKVKLDCWINQTVVF